MTGLAAPHSVLAEQTVLATVLLDASVTPSLNWLAPSHFYLAAHQALWSACQRLAAAAPSLPAEPWAQDVALELQRSGQLATVGGATALARLMDSTPTTHDVREHAETVYQHWQRREVLGWSASVAAAVEQGDAAEVLARAELQLAQLRGLERRRERPNPLGLRDATGWTGDLPEISWLSRDLHLAPGRPLAVVAYPGVGKTLLAADLALAVAGSEQHRLFWGGLRVERQGVVVHLDLEVGEALTRARYHRLAVGRWAHISDWGERLRYRSYPAWSLVSPKAEEVLLRALEGAELCLIDSLAAACPGVDENSARIIDCLGLLARVSEATGCSIVVLHHEGKPSVEGTKEARFRGRGSSAIQGAWGSQWSVTPRDGQLLFEHGKSQWGATEKAFALAIEDVGEPDARGRKPGVRLVRMEGAGDTGDAPATPIVVQKARREILNYLDAVGITSYGQLKTALKRVNNDAFSTAIRILMEDGQVVRTKVGKSTTYERVKPDLIPTSSHVIPESRDDVDGDGEEP